MIHPAAPTRTQTPPSPERGPEEPTPALLERLHASPQGLSQAEAQQRLARYGYNELAEKRISPLRRLLS